MDKHDFLTALYSRLHTLPEEDARRSVDYYCEMIDDRIEDGLSEDEAVAAVGDVDEIAATILAKREENRNKIIVALLPDLGDRYLSTELFG